MTEEARIPKHEEWFCTGLPGAPDFLLSSPRPPRLRGSHLLRSCSSPRLASSSPLANCCWPVPPRPISLSFPRFSAPSAAHSFLITGELLLASATRSPFVFAALRAFGPSRSTLLNPCSPANSRLAGGCLPVPPNPAFHFAALRIFEPSWSTLLNPHGSAQPTATHRRRNGWPEASGIDSISRECDVSTTSVIV